MAAGDPSVNDALDNLVDQFSDPLSFLRELIQNALDAGTPAVDVWLEFTESEASDAAGDKGATGAKGAKAAKGAKPSEAAQDARGVMIIHVDDYGEGMDREIIDKRLTRLFSSSKDGDFTKIGRFGIGFVSVFAIAPDAVCLDTARGGESWRVLFRRDRSFSRIARDVPVDGTKIQVIKGCTRAEYDDYLARSREVVRYWCKHVESEITFQHEPLNEPLDLALPSKVRHEEPGTTVVAGYTRDGSAAFGFYNKGLTLLEGTSASGVDALFPGVAYKVSSRYLEHTLTRDNVLHDENYHKAMALVAELVGERLPAQLLTVLGQAAAAPGGDPEALEHLCEVAARELSARAAKLPAAVRAVAPWRRVGGPPLTVADTVALKEKGRLYLEGPPSGVAPAVEREHKAAVLAVDPESSLAAVVQALPGPPAPALAEAFCLPRPAEEPERRNAGWRALEAAALAALEAEGHKVGGLALAHFDYPGSPIAERVAVTQRKVGELTPLAEARAFGAGLFSRRRTLVVNADHPTVRELEAMAPAEPEVAAWLLVKLFYVGDPAASPELDARLAAFATGRRVQRRARPS